MDYKSLNEALSDFSKLRRGKPIESKVADSYDGALGYEVYHFKDDVYVKLSIYVDSYGENESICGVEFVQPQEVRVTNFEPIK
jgi:hypothetical protein